MANHTGDAHGRPDASAVANVMYWPAPTIDSNASRRSVFVVIPHA